MYFSKWLQISGICLFSMSLDKEMEVRSVQGEENEIIIFAYHQSLQKILFYFGMLQILRIYQELFLKPNLKLPFCKLVKIALILNHVT